MTEGLQHVQARNGAWDRGDALTAWRENLILERFFATGPRYAVVRLAQRPSLERRTARRCRPACGRPRRGPFSSRAFPYPIQTWSPWSCGRSRSRSPPRSRWRVAVPRRDRRPRPIDSPPGWRHTLSPMLTMLLAAAALAAAPADTRPAPVTPPNVNIPLWAPGQVPLAQGEGPLDAPFLTTFLPPEGQRNGAAVIIAPGGANIMLMHGGEGLEVAEQLNAWGITAFVPHLPAVAPLQRRGADARRPARHAARARARGGVEARSGAHRLRRLLGRIVARPAGGRRRQAGRSERRRRDRAGARRAPTSSSSSTAPDGPRRARI